MCDARLAVGCMVVMTMALIALSVSVVVGHFFGFDLGLATFLVLAAAFVMLYICIATSPEEE